MDTRLLSLIGDITLTKQTALMTFNCLKVSVKSHQFKVLILRSTFHKSNYGKIQDYFCNLRWPWCSRGGRVLPLQEIIQQR